MHGKVELPEVDPYTQYSTGFSHKLPLDILVVFESK